MKNRLTREGKFFLPKRKGEEVVTGQKQEKKTSVSQGGKSIRVFEP